MTKLFLFIFCAFTVGASYGAPSQFVGEWKIEVVPAKKDEFPFYRQIKYPKWMQIKIINGRLIGEYIDQFEYRCKFPLIEEVNNGNDLIFTNCGKTKSLNAYSPIHHVKLLNGKLAGIVFTNKKVFEWKGERINQ